MHPVQEDIVGGPIFQWPQAALKMQPDCVNLRELKSHAEHLATQWSDENGFDGFPAEYLLAVQQYVQDRVMNSTVTTDEDGNVYIRTTTEEGGYRYAFAVRPSWFI